MENRMDENLKKEIENRRTFAIISHPDAGKTTLTEKFLLYGGAINTAGSVKGKANSKYAVSDWMGIEKERGKRIACRRKGLRIRNQRNDSFFKRFKRKITVGKRVAGSGLQ